MKRSNHALRALLAAATGLASSAAALPASAQMAHISDNDWRQADRHDALVANSAKPTFALELRFGPYLPNIDSEFSGGKTPFTTVFGTKCDQPAGTAASVKQHLNFGAELDALPVRIPYVGMFGLGVGWSYSKFGNKALLVKPTATTLCSDETTSLTIMPMNASLVLRVDELMRRTGIPLVPYGKAGAGFALWRATTDSGTEQCSSASSDPAAAAACATPHSGFGLSPSMHFALGGMLALNFIDQQASARLDETTGIHHVYVFGEWYNDTITLASKSLRAGASGWVAGFAVDL